MKTKIPERNALDGVPSPEEREETYFEYVYAANSEDTMKRAFEMQSGQIEAEAWKELKTGKYEHRHEAVEAVIRDKGYVMPTARNTVDTLSEMTKRDVKQFLTSRGEHLRKLFTESYLAPMVLAGMRAGFFNFGWWRSTNYGFSIHPIEGDEYKAFPYRSIDEMTEDDKRAFLWTVEDIYYNIERCDHSNSRELVRKKDFDGFMNIKFKAYPKEGYTRAQLIEIYSEEDDTLKDEDLDNWYFETELWLPIVVNRLQEAIYYAIKYKGEEYIDYIKSLSVEEDFDYGTTDERILYKNVMKKNYIWHSEN